MFPYGTTEYWRKIERKYDDWIKEFTDFIRDHRSQDPVILSVERVERDQCAACGREWELSYDEDASKTICACCGEEVEPDIVCGSPGAHKADCGA